MDLDFDAGSPSIVDRIPLQFGSVHRSVFFAREHYKRARFV